MSNDRLSDSAVVSGSERHGYHSLGGVLIQLLVLGRRQCGENGTYEEWD